MEMKIIILICSVSYLILFFGYFIEKEIKGKYKLIKNTNENKEITFAIYQKNKYFFNLITRWDFVFPGIITAEAVSNQIKKEEWFKNRLTELIENDNPKNFQTEVILES